ncbi:glycine-rich RNA-binding protein-like protein isoform X1 [Tanacetum coccineum]
MEQELRLKREAAERAFEAHAEKDRTLMRFEELRFLATSTKGLDDDNAYWIKKQKQLSKNKMRNDLGDEDDEDEDEYFFYFCLLIIMASGDVEFRCFVGGLAWATTDQALEEAFSKYGEVLESKIINDRETGRSRGFGFVTFKDEQAMRDAIEAMNGQSLDGRNITVNEAQSRGSGGGGGRRDGGGYGGGGGGYGGGRREGGGGSYGGGGRDRGYGGGDGGARYSRGGGDAEGNWRN